MQTLSFELHKCECARCSMKEIIAFSSTRYILSDFTTVQTRTRADATLSQLNDNDEIIKIKKTENEKAKQTKRKRAKEEKSFKSLAATSNMSDDNDISEQDRDAKRSKLLIDSDISFIANNVNTINSKNADASNIIELEE